MRNFMVQVSTAEQIGQWVCYKNPSYGIEMGGLRWSQECHDYTLHGVDFIHRTIRAEDGINVLLTPVTASRIKQEVYARTLSGFIDVINPPGLGYIVVSYAKGYKNGY